MIPNTIYIQGNVKSEFATDRPAIERAGRGGITKRFNAFIKLELGTPRMLESPRFHAKRLNFFDSYELEMSKSPAAAPPSPDGRIHTPAGASKQNVSDTIFRLDQNAGGSTIYLFVRCRITGICRDQQKEVETCVT